MVTPARARDINKEDHKSDGRSIVNGTKRRGRVIVDNADIKSSKLILKTPNRYLQFGGRPNQHSARLFLGSTVSLRTKKAMELHRHRRFSSTANCTITGPPFDKLILRAQFFTKYLDYIFIFFLSCVVSCF
jgi:hypothetical protein